MKRITKEELPDVLTDEIIEILVEMAMESPKTSFDWRDISNYLSEHDYPALRKVLDEVQKRQKAMEQAKEDAKSDEQKVREKREWKEFVENAGPNEFYGNMGEPVGVYDYKYKFGIWPLGIDDSIAPLELTNKLSDEQITKIATLYLNYMKSVQWQEVYESLLKFNYDFSIIFNKVYEINNYVFPVEGEVKEFKKKYGVWPPDYDEN